MNRIAKNLDRLIAINASRTASTLHSVASGFAHIGIAARKRNIARLTRECDRLRARLHHPVTVTPVAYIGRAVDGADAN